ncbi:MAG: redoxin domain-containing protein [Chthoniobacteraceae bacterium]
MRPILFLILMAFAAAAPANVVRKAPDFSWPGAGSKSRSLRSLSGQPVVLVIAASPRSGAFRKQTDWLEKTYSQLAAKGTVFIAAFREGEGPVKSNIPFVVANNGGAVASAYGVEGDFALVIIGKDGNVDYQTDKVRTGERVRDVIINNFELQAATRK